MAARQARREDPGPEGGPTERASLDAVAMGRLTEAVLPSLVARFEASGLGELEVRRGEWRIRLRKPLTPDPAPGAHQARGAGGGATASSRGGAAASAGTGGRAGVMAAVGPGRSASSSAPAATSGRRVALSPAVGYFAPLEAATAGRAVCAGDVLGHVDVLGVRQEVVAPADGFVARILAEPGQAVEYGQELVRLEATSRATEAAAAEPLGAGDATVSEG
ncbi:MAG: acetyl-CoA carboxylase biotin carboxyl carrier protein [Candidatus Limnocylindrales bacterium]